MVESGRTYYAGSIILKPNVTLYLEKGSMLRPIPDVENSFIYRKSPAVFLRYVKNAYFENCKFTAKNEKQIFANEAMIMEECEDICCERIRTEGFL